MPLRFDYGTIGEATRTPQGGMAVPADLTRAGVFTYLNPDGTSRREWRPLAEVQRADTLASLRGAPLTVRHPAPGRLAPENHDRYSRGHVGDDVRMDGTKTAATIYAQGKEALDAIGKGWRQVSCGYDARRIDVTPGIVPDGEPDAGQRYDMVQRDIIYNHVALVPKGRAGADVRLRLDAAGDAPREDEDMEKIEIIGGTEYTVGTPAHADARRRQDAADAARDAEVVKLRADAAEARGALAAVKVRLDALDAAEKVRLDAEALAALVATGTVVLGKSWKADGLTAQQVTDAILAKQFPAVRLDSVDEAERPAFVKGLLASIKAPLAAAPAKPSPRVLPFPGAPLAGGYIPLADQYRRDSMVEPCDGRGFAVQRKKPQQPSQPTMMENRP